MQMSILSKMTILLILLQFTHHFSIQSTDSPNTGITEDFHYLTSNYSSNMSEAQLKYITNSISSAQRRYNQSQMAEIAQLVAKNIATVFNKPWSVIVLSKGVNRIGVGAFASQNKMASFVKAGNYELSYVALQKNGCISPNNSIKNNDTKNYQGFSKYLTNSNITYLKALVSSSSTYAGDDIQENSIYIKNQMKKNSGQEWNTVIVEPAVKSSSYICATYDRWALFINYVDFGWNYYIFGGDNN